MKPVYNGGALNTRDAPYYPFWLLAFAVFDWGKFNESRMAIICFTGFVHNTTNRTYAGLIKSRNGCHKTHLGTAQRWGGWGVS